MHERHIIYLDLPTLITHSHSTIRHRNNRFDLYIVKHGVYRLPTLLNNIYVMISILHLRMINLQNNNNINI